MSDRSELEELRRLDELERKAAGGAAPAPQQSAAPYQPYQGIDPASDTERFGENPGTGKGGAEFHQGIASTPARLVKSLAQMAGQDQRLPEVVNQSAQVADTGFGTAGRIVGDIAATAAPMGAVTRGVQGVRALNAPGFVPALGRVGISAAEQAGYGAALSPDQQGEAALWGAGGGAAGHVLGRAMGGLVRPTAEAQTLLDRGVALTPGQAAGAGSFAKRFEETAASLPVAGHAIKGAQRRAVEDANVAAAQTVADMVDNSVRLGRPPREAIEQTRESISRAYEQGLGGMSAPGAITQAQLGLRLQALPNQLPMVPEREFQSMWNFVDQRVGNMAANNNGMFTGEMLKQLDSEIGQHVRNLQRSPVAAEKTAAPAWRELQQSLREVMEMAQPDPARLQQLQQANAAYRQLLVLERAMLPGNEMFTPRRLRMSLDNARVNNGPLREHSNAMSATLPNTVPDSGTAERLLMTGLPALLMGGGAGANSMGYDTLGAGMMAAGALGSRPGARLMTGGYGGQSILADALRRYVPAATRPKKDDQK